MTIKEILCIMIMVMVYGTMADRKQMLIDIIDYDSWLYKDKDELGKE